jgi:hypothetical protein
VDDKEADRQVEMTRQRLLSQMERGFAPDPRVTEVQSRQVYALEFIAFALGELVREMRRPREAGREPPEG